MIQLAAFVHQVEIPSAIFRLRRDGHDIPAEEEAIRRYVNHVLTPSRLANTFWKQAKKHLLKTTPSTLDVLRRLHMKIPLEHPRWRDAEGQMVGSFFNRDVERLVWPHVIHDITQGGQYKKHHSRFRGRNWKDVVVFPLQDLPGRLRGFYFAGRECASEDDFVYHWVQFQYRGPHAVGGESRCAGMYLHPGTLTTDSQTVIALDDPVMVYRLQSRHFRHDVRPLPLVGYVDTESKRPRGCWRHFANKKLVFWAPDDPMAAFRQAIRHNAWVSFSGPDEKTPYHLEAFVNRMTPFDLLSRVQNAARHWTQAVGEFLRHENDNTVIDFISQMEMGNIQIPAMIQKLTGETRERLQRISRSLHAGREVVVERSRVEERSDGWYLTGRRNSNEPIVNAAIQIDYVISHAKAGVTLYKGVIRHNEQKFDFLANKKEFDKAPLNWLSQYMIDNSMGILKYSNSWNSKILQLILSFHEPELVSGIDSIGYDEKQQRFVLPEYAIEFGGDVKTHPEGVLAEVVPGRSIEYPEEISPQELNEIDDPIAWAGLISVLANFIAPSRGENPCGIGLLGAGADAVVNEVCQALGCAQMDLKSSKSIEPIWDEERRHGLPVMVHVRPGRRLFASWIDADRQIDGHNCVSLMDPITYQVKRLMGDWHLIHDISERHLSEESVRSLRRVFPAYLKDYMARHTLLPEVPQAGWWARVWSDVVRFVEDRYGDSQHVRAAREYYEPFGYLDAANALVDLLSVFIHERRVVVVPEGFQENRPALLSVEHDGRSALAIPKQQLVNLLINRGVRLADIRKITRTLVDGDVLLEDRDDAWIVCSQWWSRRYRQHQAFSSSMLRVTG